ncbi:hypothetical protein [Leifsonia poae]|uniref:hypothetical protein n=1 Tax=Leifsonia poae TaxID=110933 RepID=UPI001CBD119F|nr:hypothetical protein [Leifsonia poae]
MRRSARVLGIIAVCSGVVAVLSGILPTIMRGDSGEVMPQVTSFIAGVIAMLNAPSVLLALLAAVGMVLMRALLWRPHPAVTARREP